MQKVNRRRMLVLALAAPAVAGCSPDSVQEAIETTDTQTLEQGRIALRGFAIVAYLVGARVIMLPTPGVRVLGVALIVTSVATKLAVEYLDVELKKRYITEELNEDEARRIESSLAVVFRLENDETEKVPLGANRYE